MAQRAAAPRPVRGASGHSRHDTPRLHYTILQHTRRHARAGRAGAHTQLTVLHGAAAARSARSLCEPAANWRVHIDRPTLRRFTASFIITTNRLVVLPPPGPNIRPSMLGGAMAWRYGKVGLRRKNDR